MAYDRWGMTNEGAAALTGKDVASLTDDVLNAAEADLYDALGWEPDWDAHAGTDPLPPRVRAFGRAVAWQGAYRIDNPAGATDGEVAVSNESMTDYSVTYARPVTEAPYTASRSQRLLVRWGWVKGAGTTGHTRGGYPFPPGAFQNA